jgi:hypothetical protein
MAFDPNDDEDDPMDDFPFDLDDFVPDDDGGTPDIADMSPRELEEYVMKMGSVSLDEQGRMLISCPNNANPAFCGLYPVPGPEGDVEIQCTGPLNTNGNSGHCRYGGNSYFRYDTDDGV